MEIRKPNPAITLSSSLRAVANEAIPSLLPVILAKAGIQKQSTGFPVKLGMTKKGEIAAPFGRLRARNDG